MYNLQIDKNKYFLLGKIVKTYGYSGGLVMHLESDDPESYGSLSMIFIDMDQSLVPWFINNISIRDDLATISLDDLIDQEKARAFVGKDVYLPANQLKPLEDNQFYYHEIIGYQAIDEKHGNIGIVSQILDRPEQEIIIITKGETEIMVPLTEEMIKKLDRKKKTIYLKTPQGLIDLYL